MRLLADPLNVVGAGIEVAEGSLALIVSNREVGEWPLDQVAIEVASDGFHMRVDGEEFVFVTQDHNGFARALGVDGTNSHQVAPSQETKRRRWTSRPSRRRSERLRKMRRIDLRNANTQRLLGLFVGLVGLGLIARGVLTGLLVVSGMVGLVVACVAILDPLLAARLPGNLPATRWALTGLVVTAAGMVLLII